MRFALISFVLFLSSCTCGSLSTYSSDYGIVKNDDSEENVDSQQIDASDTSKDDDDEQHTPTGLGGGMLQIGSTFTPCVDCFIGVPEIDSFAAAVFHPSTVNTWYDWVPPIGTCSVPSGPNVNPPQYYDVGSFVEVISPSVVTRLNRFYESGRPTYRSGQLGVYGYSNGADYELSVGSNSTTGEFTIENVVTTPREFTHLQPSQYFSNDPYNAFTGILRRSYTNQFTYSPSGDSDLFILTVDVYDYTGATYLGGVMCVDADDGSFTMPSGMLTSFPAYSLAAITYYKWIITESVVPTSGDTFEGVGQYGVVGTAILQ